MTSTQNNFFFGIRNKQLSPALPVIITTRQQAYRTAAYIMLLGAILPEEDPASGFEEIRKEIVNT